MRPKPVALRVRYPRYDHGEPIRWLGTVPLAGILLIVATLVLLTYGTRTHVLTVDLPIPYPEHYMEPLSPAYDRIAIDAQGRARINSAPVSDRQLYGALIARPAGAGQPSLVFEPDAAVPYSRVLRVLGILRATGSLERCFLFGNTAQFRHFDRPETFTALPPAQPRTCLVPSPTEVAPANF